jgi:hypothetical protein
MSNLAVVGQDKLALVQSPMAGNLKIQTMDDLSRLCNMLAKSEYFADAKSAAQAGVKVLYGAELGFPPITSMKGIHIIKGNPTVGANLIAAKIKASRPRYNYRIAQENGKALHTDKLCKLEAYEDGVLVGTETFTAEDAQRMGTQNMGKFPKNMLFARCISNLHRFYFPDLFGGMPVYTPEEFGGIVDDQGSLVELEPDPSYDLRPSHPAKPALNLISKEQIEKLKEIGKSVNMPVENCTAIFKVYGYQRCSEIEIKDYNAIYQDIVDTAESWVEAQPAPEDLGGDF